MLAMSPPEQSRTIRHHARTRRYAVNHQRPDHHRHGGVPRDAQRQHWDERRLRARIVGGFRRRDAPDVAAAELPGGARDFLLNRVGRKGCQQRAAAG